MFKSEAKLFLSANNNVNLAKTLINECKRLILDFDLEGNRDCKNLKGNINRCDINSLVTVIEDAKQSLMNLDQGFASEYMALLQEHFQTSTIDTSSLSEEEKMQYSIQMDSYTRDYNQTLLYMLEKYEESGMLTDEMKQQLQYQRETMAQYDIKDKMAVLDSSTAEYINLFKQCADYDRKLINLNTNLSEEEKASYLKEYDTQYNQNLNALINSRDARLKRELDEKELNKLYSLKEDNNGFWHPFVENEIEETILNKKISMGIASEDEIAYKNMNGWDRFLTDTGTFAASTFTGLFNITEGIGDSFVMLGSAVNIVDKDWASDYISRDISGELYQGIQLSNNMNSYSAYGTWHTAGEAFGGFVGKAGITFAAPWASAALYGLDAMGQSAETSFNNGDDYWAAFGKSVVSGIGGAAEGYGFAKLNLGIRNFATSGAIKTVGETAWSGIKNFGATLTSPGGLKVVGGNLSNLAKTSVKRIPSSLGKAGLATLKDADALIETGCVLANNLIECAQSGEWNFEKMLKEAGAVFAINYFMSFATTLALDINTKKTNLDDVATSNLYDGQPTDKLFDSEPTDKLFDSEPTDKLFDSEPTDKLFDDTTPEDSKMEYIGEQIVLANANAAPGKPYTIFVNSIDDLPTYVYYNIMDPVNVNFNVNGNILNSYEIAVFKSLGISDVRVLSQIKSNPVDFYISNVQNLNRLGLSFDDCVQIFDININKYGVDDALGAALAYNDKNIFLITKANQLAQNGLLDPSDVKPIADLISCPSANIDSEALQSFLSKYLDQYEMDTLDSIIDSGKMDLTPNEAAALYQYQKAGGHEIINYNRGNRNLSLDTIETWMNDFQTNNGTGVIRDLSTGKTVIEEIDSAIAKNLNKQTVTAIRYCNGVGPNLDLTSVLNGTMDPQDLIGSSFDDLANTSYTILDNKETFYSQVDPNTGQYRNKIKIEAVIPSGTGAFIESQGGLNNYTVMEFLTKRNTKTNIVNAYWDVDGRLVLQTLVTSN